MTTVINDIAIEPKAAAPAKEAAPAGEKSGGGKSGPELERELDKVHRRDHERALRAWAH
jgi:hypothetical protein